VIIAGLVGMALADPRDALGPIVWCALAVAFGSATQDIALDAYRIESADTQRQAALAATYQTGYRLAMIWAGAGVLWIAARRGCRCPGNYQHAAWHDRLPGHGRVDAGGRSDRAAVARARAPRCRPHATLAEWLQGALVDPFADFLRRYRWQAALILALIAVYRISDVVMGIMANPFYVDMGYTKDEVAAVTKVYGVIMTLLGAFVGGVLSMRFGVMRMLMLGAMLSAATNLLFAWLAGRGHDVTGADWWCRPTTCRGHRVGGVHCLPVQPDERELFGHAVRAVQLDDAAAAQMAGGFLGKVRGCLWLRAVFQRHRDAGGAGAAAGVAGGDVACNTRGSRGQRPPSIPRHCESGCDTSRDCHEQVDQRASECEHGPQDP
jgi:hypothetical protein